MSNLEKIMGIIQPDIAAEKIMQGIQTVVSLDKIVLRGADKPEVEGQIQLILGVPHTRLHADGRMIAQYFQFTIVYPYPRDEIKIGPTGSPSAIGLFPGRLTEAVELQEQEDGRSSQGFHTKEYLKIGIFQLTETTSPGGKI
jgi:hypothetical protein